jgi:hypothetical protein
VEAVTEKKNPLDARHYLRLMHDGEVLAVLPGIRVDTLVASPRQDYFVGLANGILEGGTAVVVFSRDGAITLLVSHTVAAFDICDEDATRMSKWYDVANPSVRFDERWITLNGCQGERIALMEAVASALQRRRAEFAPE